MDRELTAHTCRLMPLSSLTALTAIKLQHCSGIRKDLAGLKLLTSLSSLDLCGCQNLQGSGLSVLAALTCLRWAPLVHTGQKLWDLAA